MDSFLVGAAVRRCFFAAIVLLGSLVAHGKLSAEGRFVCRNLPRGIGVSASNGLPLAGRFTWRKAPILKRLSAPATSSADRRLFRKLKRFILRNCQGSKQSNPLPTPTPCLSNQILNTAPANSAIKVALKPNLTWEVSAAGQAGSYLVYLSSDLGTLHSADQSSPAFLGSSQSAQFLVPSQLEPLTSYYWRIDVVSICGTATGEVFQFTTRATPLSAAIISPPLEITDSSQGHTTGNAPNPEATTMTRIGDNMYFLYRADFSSGSDKLFIRRLALNTGQFSPAVLVDQPTDEANFGYHSESTLLRDGSGHLHLFNQNASYISGHCLNQPGIAPRWRIIPDLLGPVSWTAPGCLPSRVLNQGTSQFYDIMGVYDPTTGITHAAGQSYGIPQLDGSYVPSFSRTYYRINPSGAPDGPHIIVNADGGQGGINLISSGLILPGIYLNNDPTTMTKGDLALGKEALGPRSLHLMWNIRLNGYDASIPTLERQINAHLFYARSTDGGATWRSADGAASRALSQRINFSDMRYAAHQGAVEQDGERGFDVDNSGNPFVVFGRHRPGTGTMFGNFVDNRSEGVWHDLAWAKWDGSSWVYGTIDATQNWRSVRPRVRIDALGKIYVFVGDIPKYYLSTDGGATWQGPHLLAPPGVYLYSNGRFFNYPDPFDANFHHIVFHDRYSQKRYYIKMQLTNE